jgi:hypothetical protein
MSSKIIWLIFTNIFLWENNALSELQKLSSTATQNYEKFDSALTKKKEKLFQLGNPTQWELSILDSTRIEELKNNKDAAIKAMLPRDAIKLNHLKTNHLMLSTQCYNEVRQSNDYDLEWTHKNLKEVSEKFKDIFTDEIENIKVLAEL